MTRIGSELHVLLNVLLFFQWRKKSIEYEIVLSYDFYIWIRMLITNIPLQTYICLQKHISYQESL